jgi:hypothetical protein
MKQLCHAVVAAIVIAQAGDAAGQAEKRRVREILIHTPNGWMLHIHSDGSGHLQYGSSFGDGWGFKAGTIDAAKAAKDLKALKSDPQGGLRSHFVFHFEAERKSAEQGPPARYTKDVKIIPPLFERAIAAAEKGDAARKALLLKKYPPGLPKEK